MILIQSEKLDVYMFADKDYNGDTLFKVKYGLQYDTFADFHRALSHFNGCISHSADCESIK